MRIVSWNVNGLRAAERKGFRDWLRASRADVVLLQELRATPDQLDPPLLRPGRYQAFFHPAERPGYSGVAVYTRRKPDEICPGLGIERFDVEGRALMARFGKLCVISAYFPKGRDQERIAYKLDFYAAMLRRVRRLHRQGYEVIVGGDYNTAHRPIDLARPKENAGNTGFLPAERAWLDRYAAAGLADTFRHLHPSAAGRYTWWTQRAGARARNIGWRIDYHWADRSLLERLRAATIEDHVHGSDHCPVGLTLAE